MAAAGSSSNSVANSQSSANRSPSTKLEQPQDASSEMMDSKAMKTEPAEESNEAKTELKEDDDPLAFLSSKEHIEKFKKYEANLKQYLMHKYFSDKTIFGGNIFDVKMNIEGQTITTSRLHQFQSYLDPATFDEMINKGSSSSAEPTAPAPASNSSNEKPPSTT